MACAIPCGWPLCANTRNDPNPVPHIDHGECVEVTECGTILEIKAEPGQKIHIQDDAREQVREPTLGITQLDFEHDGSIVAKLHDDTEVTVELPDDWQCQATMGGVVWRHRCGTHVLGVPVCRRCG